MITAQEIREKEFTKAVRGYGVEEVDAFLDRICEDLERYAADCSRLSEENAALKEQIERYKAQEGAMLTTLETAKSLMSDISASAEKRAGILLKNAELDADLKLRKATEEVEKLRNEQDILTRKVSSIKTRLKSLLEGELKHIDEITDDIVTEFSMSERPRGLGEDSAFSRTDPFLKQLEDDLSSEPEDLLRPADLDTDLTRTRVVRG
ncbi:MAG: DivIVA domain-containing protein [Firmicutes bacterium]|nr:DivIVA domain-containing protein [Bacillota bacterium]